MPRLKRKMKTRKLVSPTAWRFLNDQDEDGSLDDRFGFLALESRDDLARPLWEQCREDILAEFARNKPGVMPRCWFRFDAPGKLRTR